MGRTRPLEDRLWEKVDRTGGPGACWPFTWKLNGYGYGRIWMDGKTHYAHRVAYTLLRGPIPDGLVLDHFVCSNPPCCNPDHLRAVSGPENNARNAQSKVTECPQGHPYDSENTVRKGGSRVCRECRRASGKKREAARRARNLSMGLTTAGRVPTYKPRKRN